MNNIENLLLICPDEEKNYLLDKIHKEKKLINIKFMNIETFKANYFYHYDYTAISYLMNVYQVNLDISKMYLENMYFIDMNQNYQNTKLNFLKEMKGQLIENDLLKFNNQFSSYLKTKTIKVLNYPNLEKYLVDIFQELNAAIITKQIIPKNFTVYETNDIYEEVTFTIQKIMELYQRGVKLNHIYLLNLNEDYTYITERMFQMFHLPIQLPNMSRLDSSILIKKYLLTGLLPDSNSKNIELINKLITIENSLLSMKNDPNYKIFLKDKIKNTHLSSINYREAVNIGDLFNREYSQDDHVFVLGFNEGILPNNYKDEDYLTDQDKKEVPLYSTHFKNKREKEVVIQYLSNIPNLYISYKKTSFKDHFYPSSIIEDYHMKVMKCDTECFQYSNQYNLRMLSIYLDNYYKFKEEHKYLKPLHKTYRSKLLYNTYSNIFTGIKQEEFLSYLEKLGLSYTSMNTYNLCKFKYYINYVLKLDPFCETFQTLIGNLFHHVLELSLTDNFDFERTWNDYIKDKHLEIKELFFLERLKKNLLNTLEIIKEQKMYTDFKNCYGEKSITIPLKCNELEAYFTGKIDKIMYYNKYNDTYFAIVDYKTGSFDANLNYMKYGIGMQLATYLYLVEKSNIFENPIFTGMYFQKILMGNVSYDGRKSYLEKMRDSLKLVGYSTNDEEILGHFDHDYTDSKVIKSMKMTSKGFSRYTKLIDKDMDFNVFKYTEKIIYETLSKIITANFTIDPKRIEFKNVSCKYCKYRNLCYVKEEDYINLEKVDDLSFVGDE